MRAARVEIGADGPGGCGIGSRIGRTHPDPLFQHGDFRIRQLPPGRHFERFIANRFDQQALVRRARDDRRTAVASLHPSAAAVEMQPPLEDLRLGRVTLVAMFDEQRAHLLFEELPLLGAERRRVACARRRLCSQRDGSRFDRPHRHTVTASRQRRQVESSSWSGSIAGR